MLGREIGSSIVRDLERMSRTAEKVREQRRRGETHSEDSDMDSPTRAWAGPLPVSSMEKAGKAAIVLKRKARRRQDNTDFKQASLLASDSHTSPSHKMAAKLATGVASVFGSSAVSASTIRQNCRKVICIGRNYA